MGFAVDDHKGRICIGRITSGSVRKSETVAICQPGAPASPALLAHRRSSQAHHSKPAVRVCADVIVSVMGAGEEKPRTGKVTELFVYSNFSKVNLKALQLLTL